MKKLSLFFVAVCLILSAAVAQVSVWDGTHTAWTHGIGTETDPYLIENAAQLAHLAYDSNANIERYWKLTTDIDLNSLSWTPICNGAHAFKGHFDGNGHTIANLVVSGVHTSGLFSYMEGGSVKNLGIIGNSSIASSNHVGGIVGFATGNLTIDNCYNLGEISSSNSSGGIVGCVYGGLTINNCYNSGKISISSPSHVGGLVGYISGSLTINNCYNTGVVSVSNSSYSNSTYAGGLVGYTDGNLIIDNCSNSGNISSNCFYTSYNSIVGGIVGYTFGYNSNTRINNCYNTGNISSNSSADSPAGGIIGRATLKSLIISNCFNVGEISSPCAGGILGRGGIDTIAINKCYNTGSILTYEPSFNSSVGGIAGCVNGGLSIDSCYNLGNISFYKYAGGIIGYFEEYVNHILTIDNSYNSGNISTSSSLSSLPSSFYAGGIVGFAQHALIIINNCYNTDSISSIATYYSYSSYAGGIVGCAEIADIIIDKCYNSGTILASSTSLASSGGIVGWILGSLIIDNCYNAGNTASSSEGKAYAGGIAGGVRGDLTIKNNINNCCNAGSVSSSFAVGGIIGYVMYGISIGNCHNMGDISSDNAIDVYQASGGIVGYIMSGNHTIENCYNTGNIFTASFFSSGGIIGSVSSGNFTINNCYSTGSVAALNYAGGIVGRSGGAVDTINNCYNTGNISASSAGGIAGDSYATINNSHYLNTSASNPGGGIPQTAEFMKTQEFVNLLNDGPEPNSAYSRDDMFINDGYPILKWQSKAIATLLSLTVSEGELSPAFSSNIFEYIVDVEHTVASITISAIANHEEATVIGAGEKQLAVGANIFTITVTAADGITTLDYTVTVNRNGVGVVETHNCASLRVYPNPTTGELTITNYELRITSIEIFDIYGRNLSSHHLITSSSNHLINIAHFPAGVYFVKASTEVGEVVKKIVKL